MQVTFYINTSPTIKVDKNLLSAGDNSIRQCDIMGAVDVVNPVIVVKGTVNSSANYMVIGEPLNRSYFITAMDFTTAGKVIISGHVDVLSTYHSLLEDTTLNYIRGARDLNEMDDSSYPISDYLIEQYFPMSNWTDIFSNRGSDRQYLLRTIRGNAIIKPTHTLSDGAVIWLGNSFQYQDTVRYRVYQIQLTDGGKNLTVNEMTRPDIQGIQLVQDNDYVKIGTHLFLCRCPGGVSGQPPQFYYQGEDTN